MKSKLKSPLILQRDQLHGTWSQYKQSNTVKVLIAISPYGMTMFLSYSWGGRVSDTRECGILHKLLPGDIVLADRGRCGNDAG